jgi:hypothetical protein
MSTLDQPTGQPITSVPQGSYIPAQPGQYYAPPAVGGYPQHAPVVPAGYGQPALGPVGKVRSTWAVLGLTIITAGIYSLYYNFVTYEEMKKHSGEGVGGVLGLVLSIVTLGLVHPFLFAHEVGNLYARQGRVRPVTATTGLWVLLGSFIAVGPLVWLVKTNGALNAYWRSVGAR